MFFSELCLWHSIILNLHFSVAHRASVCLTSDIFLRHAYYSMWVSEDQKALCVDGLYILPYVQLASQDLSYLMEVFDCGWPLHIFLMLPRCAQVLIAVLYICLLVAPPLSPFLSLQPAGPVYPIQLACRSLWDGSVSRCLAHFLHTAWYHSCTGGC